MASTFPFLAAITEHELLSAKLHTCIASRAASQENDLDLEFIAHIRSKWATEWSQVPAFAQSNEASMKQGWLDAEFERLLEEHQAIRATANEGYDFWQTVRSELGDQEDPDAILTPLITRFPHLTSQDVDAFRVFLATKLQLALEALLAYARDGQANYKSKWFTTTIQTLLEAFVTHQGEQNMHPRSFGMQCVQSLVALRIQNPLSAGCVTRTLPPRRSMLMPSVLIFWTVGS